RIDEIACDIGNHWMLLGIDQHRRDRMLAQQRDEIRRHEARVPDLDRMPDRTAIKRTRQKLQERREVVGVEWLGGRQLPEHRTELALELKHAASKEPLD